MSAALQEAFTIRKLSPVLGAEIIGLDLAQPLDAATRRAVYDAFVRHQVLCFRDQALTPEQQIVFTEQFGTLERHIARNRGTGNPLGRAIRWCTRFPISARTASRAARSARRRGTPTSRSGRSRRLRRYCTR